jgi:hypothetical protein
MVLPFFFPPMLILRFAGPEGAKNLAGKYPPPDSDPFSDAESGKISLGCQAAKSRKREPPIPVPEKPSTFHRRAQRNAFRRRDGRQQSKFLTISSSKRHLH